MSFKGNFDKKKYILLKNLILLIILTNFNKKTLYIITKNIKNVFIILIKRNYHKTNKKMPRELHGLDYTIIVMVHIPKRGSSISIEPYKLSRVKGRMVFKYFHNFDIFFSQT